MGLHPRRPAVLRDQPPGPTSARRLPVHAPADAKTRRYALRGFGTLALLAACATLIETGGPDEQGYYWRRDGRYTPPEYRAVHVIPNGNVFLHCNLERRAEACAVTRFDPPSCDIYLPKGYKPWQLEHEEKHCDGWTHPNPLD